MRFSIKNSIKISIFIALLIFVIQRVFFNGGFDAPINNLLKIFIINFLYVFVLTTANMYFFYYLETKLDWKTQANKRLIIGAVGSIILTMLGLVVLRFITLVIVINQPVYNFIYDSFAVNYYLFGFVITVFVSLLFHVFFFYKALTEKKVTEQQIVAKTETAKYESLKSQIDPHFLFNSLNVLTSLISEDPKKAEKFTSKLSKVYRYVLEQKNKDLVSLNEELEFAQTYLELIKMRFENAVNFEIPEKATNPELKIIPLSLQLLLENTIKHNVISEENPLKVTIEEENGFLVITNNFNPKTILEKSTKVGLNNIVERFNLITLKKVSIEKTSGFFTVKMPLLTQKIQTMKTITNESAKYLRAVERVHQMKEFYSNLIAYCIIIPLLIYINLKYTPGFHWFWFPMFGWGIGLTFHGLKAFNYNPFLGSDWEDRKIKEFMNNDNKQFWE